MKYILVTVEIEKNKNYELKIPSEITAGEFVEMLQGAFGIQGTGKRSLHVEPLGRILGEHEILMKEGVYNGSKIILL